jgi:hypothetical protein
MRQARMTVPPAAVNAARWEPSNIGDGSTCFATHKCVSVGVPRHECPIATHIPFLQGHLAVTKDLPGLPWCPRMRPWSSRW